MTDRKDLPPHLQRLDAKYAEAWANPGTVIPLGRDVVCDICSADWTDRTESGGVLIGSYAYCPDCAASKSLPTEREKIDEYCPPDESFADWVRRRRGPDGGIRVGINEPPDKDAFLRIVKRGGTTVFVCNGPHVLLDLLGGRRR